MLRGCNTQTLILQVLMRFDNKMKSDKTFFVPMVLKEIHKIPCRFQYFSKTRPALTKFEFCSLIPFHKSLVRRSGCPGERGFERGEMKNLFRALNRQKVDLAPGDCSTTKKNPQIPNHKMTDNVLLPIITC